MGEFKRRKENDPNYSVSTSHKTYVFVGSKSLYSRLWKTHLIKCDCKTIITIEEFKEPIINDAGYVIIECQKCNKEHRLELLKNVDGIEIFNGNCIEHDYY